MLLQTPLFDANVAAKMKENWKKHGGKKVQKQNEAASQQKIKYEKMGVEWKYIYD